MSQSFEQVEAPKDPVMAALEKLTEKVDLIAESVALLVEHEVDKHGVDEKGKIAEKDRPEPVEKPPFEKKPKPIPPTPDKEKEPSPATDGENPKLGGKIPPAPPKDEGYVVSQVQALWKDTEFLLDAASGDVAGIMSLPLSSPYEVDLGKILKDLSNVQAIIVDLQKK